MNLGQLEIVEATLSSGTATYQVDVSPEVPGVVMFPDIGGLRPLFAEHALRLGAEGFNVSVVELWPDHQDADVPERLNLVGQLDETRALNDAVEAADRLGSEECAVLGFCMGAMNAMRALRTNRFGTVVAFYGMVTMPERWRSASQSDAIDSLTGHHPAPVLAICGTEDEWVPLADRNRLKMTGATVLTYGGAQHGFVHDPTRPAHLPEAARDAWGHALAFMHSGGAAIA